MAEHQILSNVFHIR